MIVLSCNNLNKSFGIDTILENISFTVNEGDKVGVIGPNGEGKSTLFKIITKELSQDSGEVFIDKTSNLGYLSQNLSLDSSKTIYEETKVTFYEISEDEIERYIETGEPMDKAGSYGIQGKAAVFIKGIEGDYYNVVGFPIARFLQEIRK